VAKSWARWLTLCFNAHELTLDNFPVNSDRSEVAQFVV
jgi:hypothetical protein